MAKEGLPAQLTTEWLGEVVQDVLLKAAEDVGPPGFKTTLIRSSGPFTEALRGGSARTLRQTRRCQQPHPKAPQKPERGSRGPST